jgi:hypothetical protein
MELQHTRTQPMVAFARALSIFTLQDKTDLARLMRMLVELKSGRHERFGNANPVKLAETQFFSKTMDSFYGAHTPTTNCMTTRIPT